MDRQSVKQALASPILSDHLYPSQTASGSCLENVQDVLKAFTQNDKKLKGTAGFTAILHTHSRPLDYHPHIHVVMPGASINEKTGLWRVKPSGYLFNHEALAKVFRAKLLQAIVDNGLMVTFRYLHAKTGQYRSRTVTGEYFLYLLMLHVLPKGFRRTRYYGFLHPCSKKLILFLQMVLRVNPLSMFVRKLKERPTITCPVCGAVMKIIMTKIPKPPTRQAACLT